MPLQIHIGFIFVVITALVAGVIVFFTPRRILELFAKAAPDVLYFARTTEKIVALTIDDGPSTETPKILSVLSRYSASATFFLISERVRSGGEGVVRDMVHWDHEIGNHLTRDERSVNLPLGDFERKLVAADEVLREFQDMRWMRPGGAMFNSQMLRVIHKHNYKCTLASYYPFDQTIPLPALNARHALANVRPGAIFVLHDGKGRGKRTAVALEKILPELARRGYRVVTLSELFGAGAA